MIQVALKYNRIPVNIPSKIEPSWKSIGYDTKNIWSEYQLINRLLYRSRNQHKASFSLQHLKEVKRLGERIGKLEMWLKANFVENGEKLFDFLGYLNTLRLLLEKNLEACRKTFYFYCHYLDQSLFVPLALVVIGSVSSLHSELMQWNKYARILYESGVEKLHKLAGKDKVAQWCKENNLEEELTKSEAVALPPAPKEPQTKPQTVPSKNKPESSGTFNKKKPFKKVKTSSSGNNDEIDDIFGAF